MYNILLLHEMSEAGCKLQDYLQLGGCKVSEMVLGKRPSAQDLQRQNLVLLECGEPKLWMTEVLYIRNRTQLPIVVVSERDDEWEKIKLFQAGIDDYLVKPFQHGELTARIQAHIARYKRLTRPFGIIKVDKLEINAYSRRVFLDGVEVDLRLKEFEILLYLAQRMGETVSKREIYESVWNDDVVDPAYNTVAVHVKKLRGKIERDISNPKYIETVWGIGYRFRG